MKNSTASSACDLDDTPGIQVYSNEPRVHVANRKGPWQEIWMLIHKLDEIDTPAIDEFIRKAVGSFATRSRA